MRLHIANASWNPVEVVVFRDGEEQSLGSVWVDQYPIFYLESIPPGEVSRIVVKVSSRRGQTFRTDTILARAGSSVEVHLETPLGGSRLWQSHRAALPTRYERID